MQQTMVSNKKSGFTLIEIVVVIAIIAVLSGAVLIGVGSFRSKARDSRRIADLKQLQNALELYYNKNGTYPDTLAELSTDPDLNITNYPTDPDTQAEYNYAPCGTGTNLHNYVLGATLEADISDKIYASSNTAALSVGAVCEGAAIAPNNCQHSDDTHKYYCITL